GADGSERRDASGSGVAADAPPVLLPCFHGLLPLRRANSAPNVAAIPAPMPGSQARPRGEGAPFPPGGEAAAGGGGGMEVCRTVERGIPLGWPSLARPLTPSPSIPTTSGPTPLRSRSLRVGWPGRTNWREEVGGAIAPEWPPH